MLKGNDDDVDDDDDDGDGNDDGDDGDDDDDDKTMNSFSGERRTARRSAGGEAKELLVCQRMTIITLVLLLVL